MKKDETWDTLFPPVERQLMIIFDQYLYTFQRVSETDTRIFENLNTSSFHNQYYLDIWRWKWSPFFRMTTDIIVHQKDLSDSS